MRGNVLFLGIVVSSSFLPGATAGDVCSLNQRAVNQHAVKQQVVKQNQVFVEVPFAVPVAVPVAVVDLHQVSYSLDAGDYAGRSVRRAEAYRYSLEPPAAAASAITQHCAKCHTGEAPKAGLQLGDLSAVPLEKRIMCIRRILSDDPEVRMPKGVELTVEQRQRLIHEFSQ